MSNLERTTDRTGIVCRVPVFSDYGKAYTFALVDERDYYLVSAVRWSFQHGYATANSRTRGIPMGEYMHRLVLDLPKDCELVTDHRNGQKLDNRRSNLRVVTFAQNMQNLAPRHGGYSSYRGVTWDKGREKWVAQCQVNGKKHYLGRFDDERVAAAVAADFRAQRMPFSEERAA